jgi:hypothetical protein
MYAELLARSELRGRLRHPNEPTNTLSDNVDRDHDGLTEKQEFFRMTADSSADTDEDGIPDARDLAPNGFSRTYRERIESEVYTHFLNAKSPGGTAYCVTGFDSYLDLHPKRKVAVVVTHTILAYLRYFTDLFPEQPCRENGFVTADPIVFIPGALYAYDLEYDFGGRCGGEIITVFADLPFVGPFHLYDRWVWIS